MGWITVGDGYQITVRGTGRTAALACRNAKGRELARVPAKLRKHPDVAPLTELLGWLTEHDSAVRTTAETWMLRSLPVPTRLLHAVWPDPVWRRALTDLVVAPVTGDRPDLTRCGLLRAADPDRGTGAVDLDGETRWTDTTAICVVHPVLLGDDLPAWREFAVAIDADQDIPQLLRDVWRRPADMDHDVTAIDAFAFATYEWGSQLEQQVIRLGGRIRGESAHFTVHDHDGEPVHVTVNLRWQGPQASTYLDGLTWSRPAHAIGDIAWSEGVRILTTLYANRTAPEDRERSAAEEYQNFCTRHRRRRDLSTETAAPPAPAARHRPHRTRAALLHAGGIVTGPPTGAGEDTLLACRHTHDALDEPVVTTARRAAAPAEHAALAQFGLTSTGDTEIGTVRARPLGFLARALNRHPAHRDRIVALLPGLRSNATLAETKPGRATDALTRTADDLAGSTPELVPLYLDECSRILADVGSNAYAVRFFERARAAETHTPPADEADVIDSHLRLPRGVLPASLATHHTALAARLDPAGAYQWQRRLITAWCEAGHRAAPALATGLVTLATAAHITPGTATDPAERAADERAARAMLANGTLQDAPDSVWTALAALLHHLARTDSEARRALTLIVPTPARTSAKAKATAARRIVSTMAGIGADAPFTGHPGITAADAQTWVHRLTEQYAGLTLPVDGLPELLRDAGRLLRDAGRTCHLPHLYARNGADLALLDLALACGVPVETPHGDTPLPLAAWIAKAKRPDLAATAAHPHWGPALRAAIQGEPSGILGFGRPSENPQTEKSYVGDPIAIADDRAAATALADAPGTNDVIAAILTDHATADGALPRLYTALRDTERFTLHGVPRGTRDTLHAIVTGADPATALATTLRAGVLDELHLPALTGYDGPLHLCNLAESGPDLLLVDRTARDGVTIAAVLPGRLGRRRTGLPAPHPFGGLASLANNVCLAVVGDDVVSTAHGGPDCPHDTDLTGRPPHPAATPRRAAHQETVRFPHATTDLTVHRAPDRVIELRDPDGRAVGRYIMGANWLPNRSGGITAAPGNHRYAAGTELVPPPGWWRHLRPRDPGGSRALRAAHPATARRLLDAVPADLAARIPHLTDSRPPRSHAPERHQALLRLVPLLRPLLPEVTHDRLWLGIAALVWTAVECRERTHALAARLDLPAPAHLGTAPPATAGAHEQERATDPAGPATTTGGTPELPAITVEPRRSDRATALARLAATARAAAGLPGGHRDPVGTIDTTFAHGLPDQLGRLAATVLRAAWCAEDRAAASAEQLRDLADVPELITTDGTWSLLWEAHVTPKAVYSRANPPTGVLALDRTLYARTAREATHTVCLRYTPDPAARDPRPGERVCRGWGDPHKLTAAAGLIQQRGPAPGRRQAVLAFADATGLPLAQAALLLSPSVDFDRENYNGRYWQADHTHFTDLGLTQSRIQSAHRVLDAISDEDEHQAILNAAMPDDPAALWTTGIDIDAAVARWLHRHPVLDHVPGHTWHEIVLDHPPFGGPPAFLALLAPEGRPTVEGVLPAAAALGYRLTPGTPAARTVAAHLRRLRAACTDPALLVRVNESLPVARVEEAAGTTATRAAGTRLAVGPALELTPAGTGYELWLRPAALTGPADPLLDRLAALEPTVPAPRARRWNTVLPDTPVADVRFLLADASAGIADQLDTAPDAGHPHDPLACVPDLVDRVSQAHGLSQDAARLYLQLITLPDPDDARVARWNGWDAERHAAAAEELRGTGLLTAEEREGAERTLFAPGPWAEATSWIGNGVEAAKPARIPGAGPRLLRHLPAVPVRDLFHPAWTETERARTADGTT
ncbi:DUF4132 domain-containing protein [Marinactinospora rubrisoli]|uniref:DUF4132 domain-containing protein n=1 Tax=Marinactinospora rubrisoli TaxID=2715399 RepID=A0ABW2KPI9_9ACTN